MKKTVLTYGIISGLIVTAIMTTSMVYYRNNPGRVSNSSAMVIGYLSMLIAFALIYVGVKRYRDNENAGTISFGKAFRIGLLIALIASTMYVVAWALLYNLYMPDYMDRYAEQMIKHAEPGTTAVQLEETKAEMESYKQLYRSPLYFTLMTYAEILPVGMLVSIICAFILKRKKREAEVAVA
ncbi:DUF4199 domain-containing protein [Segetibacter aerophilus]|uniref:DUF4199 domain-containing protein n=1 Tax=Segetibacter aerophilus TaxID=670293 RepID=A0A512BIP4_9BACT|nr:DUF4199 domain-containing protein [Segetibacter aerophilus]GEO11849.1 hypothetical protein SAE01_43450 [Segetibacter aerophilus]